VLVTVEVDDEWTDLVLSPEHQSFEASVAEVAPEDLLQFCGLLS
jgi:hypothetical protein